MLTRRARLRRELLIVAGTVAVLVILAAFSFRGASGAESARPRSARPTAVAFAATYVSYLDGRATANQLTAASPEVVAIARSGGVIPAGDRDGALALRGLDFSGVRGAPSAKATIVAGDRRHTLRASLSLTYVGGRWRVSYLVPADLPTVLAPPPAPNRVAPAARAAATRFALAYATYREGATRRLPGGLAFIRQQIAASKDPLAGLGPTHIRPRLVSIDALQDGAVTSVDAVVAAHGRRISFDFILQQNAGRWQAWQFPVGAP